MIEILNMENLIPPGILDGINDAAVNEILLDIADAARAEWIKIAQKELFSSRRDYIQGIMQVRFKPGVAVITLVGVLPNLIENGMDEMDMHDTLLGPGVEVSPPGSPGKHVRKDGGYYRAIPFRHGTPRSGGAVGAPMGKPYGGHDAIDDAKKLGRHIHETAKKLAASTSSPDGGMAYGGRLPEGLAPKLRPYHATDIYAGMVREEKTYKKATQNQYTTFRNIAVDGSGQPVGSSPWIRPRTPGKFFVQKVNQFVQKIGPQAFQAYVESLG